ncbi:hypothetical protein PMAYCL1PPCAC_07676 [Pristionchus mayeri]|uniref:Uncharacterized protein n=1 Tax=Pristionchus mayeri TaxID=1317129 RepID=A0AAN4ZE61_9BILA|nr:hypothetical protein PMAYCL1PPCAC_07676 [Pristionchus mayeri]
MPLLLFFLLVPTAVAEIFMYNLCDYSIPIWEDEVIGLTSIEVVDIYGSTFIEDDLPLIGLKDVAILDPNGSISFEDELSFNPISYRIGEGARMEVKFATSYGNFLDFVDYYELDIADGFEVPMRLQPDRSGSTSISCLNASCFGMDVFGNSLTSKTATVEVGTNFAIFFCPL